MTLVLTSDLTKRINVLAEMAFSFAVSIIKCVREKRRDVPVYLKWGAVIVVVEVITGDTVSVWLTERSSPQEWQVNEKRGERDT